MQNTLVACFRSIHLIPNQTSVLFFSSKDSVYSENKLTPSEPYTRAVHQMLIEGFQRIVGLLYKATKFKDPEAYNEMNKVLDNYEKFLSEEYFGGRNF